MLTAAVSGSDGYLWNGHRSSSDARDVTLRGNIAKLLDIDFGHKVFSVEFKQKYTIYTYIYT